MRLAILKRGIISPLWSSLDTNMCITWPMNKEENGQTEAFGFFCFQRNYPYSICILHCFLCLLIHCFDICDIKEKVTPLKHGKQTSDARSIPHPQLNIVSVDRMTTLLSPCTLPETHPHTTPSEEKGIQFRASFLKSINKRKTGILLRGFLRW